MKNSFLFLAVLFYAVFAITLQETNAQLTNDRCATMDYLEIQKKADPGLELKMLLQEEQLQQWINENYGTKSNKVQTGPIIIPVVVHIVWNTLYPEEQMLTLARVQEQIAFSNRDFAGLNDHSMGVFSTGLKSNTGIQFCLAQKAPNGATTSGVEWRETTVDTIASMPINNAVKFYSLGGLDGWDPKVYLNIWVCNTSGFTGYAQFPTSGINSTYGVVVNFMAFGFTGAVDTRDNGGVTTHEIGHCVNLRHIWGDDGTACTGTDYCEDIPNQAGPTYGSYTGLKVDACSPTSPGIMYMNFMDYTNDDAWTNFTPNQTARIQALFATSTAPLYPLLSSTGCQLPSSCEIPTTLKVTSATRTTATISWTAMVNSASYNIQYRKIGARNWTSTTSSDSSKTLTGLTKNTAYEFQVQNVCTSDNGTSDYTSSYNFRTPLKDPLFETDVVESNTSGNFYIYPNPATDQVTINYTISEPGATTLTITNALGLEMARINNNQMHESGDYSINYNTTNLSPGVYYLTLRSGSDSETLKFVVIR